MRKLITLIIAAGLLAAGCGITEKSTREKDQEVQNDIMKRAQAAEPVYKPRNFLARKAINEYTRRMDSPDKLWYIYMRAESGATIGYHICRTPPLSFGVSLTAPEQVVRITGDPDQVVSSPGVDGVYYGGVDADLYFCFDAETDALIMFRAGNSVIYDKPLDLDAPRLNLVSE